MKYVRNEKKYKKYMFRRLPADKYFVYWSKYPLMSNKYRSSLYQKTTTFDFNEKCKNHIYVCGRLLADLY